ncbi:hemin receptor [Thiohalocapsa marina]|uniref:Hemin receptor n=1 Tax=Thiohalocapsa marina TaxID=424902 RepID=A0A5M8FSP2_9GAMM|nr:globin domain-containing protein [Thiohalocapsa marina]KAA6185472.1 hemin receptor [Thiohalocapsa marina]
MTPEETTLVRDSWNRLVSTPEQAAGLLYNRLFQLYPELQPLFKGEMDEQGLKLMRMIGRAVQALDDLEPLDRVIKMMGARHCGYGVRDEDYEKVGEALFWALQQQLGEAFTPKVRAAWVSVYDDLADLMRAGAAQ